MTIDGEKVILRTPQVGDEDFILKWENDEGLWDSGDTREKFSPEDVLSFVVSEHDIYLQKQLRLMICEKTTGLQLGCIDLFDFDDFHKRAGIGILIYDSKHRRKGYAIESLNLVVDHCRNKLKLKQLYCNVVEGNTSSFNLFEKCGFKEMARKRMWRLVNDSWLDEVMMQIILS